MIESFETYDQKLRSAKPCLHLHDVIPQNSEPLPPVAIVRGGGRVMKPEPMAM
jgi:hypothetical protein